MSLFFISADAGAAMAWRPAVDIYRTPEGWAVKLELAGVRREDVNVIASGSELFISGVRRDRFVEEGWSHYSMEIAYSHFERVVELPCVLDSASISIESHDGLLLVRVAINYEEERTDERTDRKPALVADQKQRAVSGPADAADGRASVVHRRY
jgi:HSP20 family protein